MKRYVTGFDGLRTLGVFAVILYHIYPNVLRGGFLGVVLFLVLSGYLVTDSLLREYQQTGKLNILQFWGRRLKRIYPLMIAVFLIVTPYLLIFQRDELRGLGSDFFSSVLSIQNWWQIAQGDSYFANIAGESPFKHIYYLSIEGQFFLLFPLLLFILLKFVKNRGKIFLILSGITLISVIWMAVLFVPGQDPTRVYYGTDTRLFSLVMGASLAFVLPLRKKLKVNERGKRVGLGLAAAAFALSVLAYFFMPAQSAVTYYGGMWAVSLLTMVLIALVAQPAFGIDKVFSNPVFSYIGSRSYGIYLWQLPVLALVAAKLLNPTAWYNVLWQLALIVGLSELSYRFIETPLKNFDYSNTLSVVRNYVFGGNWLKLKKLVTSGILLLIVAMLAVIIFSPASPHDQEILQKKILAQQAVLQKREEATANAKVSKPLKTIASKYKVEPVIAEKASEMKVLAIGDSVMVAGSTDLSEVFPQMNISAVVGEQANVGEKFLEKNQAKIKASDALLIGLGTNGTLTIGGVNYIDKIMALAGNKPVYWINNRAPGKPWISVNNAQLAAAAKKYHNLKIINWYAASAGKTDWFWSDNIHPKGTGAIAYARLIADTMAATKK
ncbi:acyltransferase family protein [Lactococcus nasutitermitis]|uniref:Acyltransferase family protein n=1 Tax=Lactococcus nasutitermitis TaxID=1652957 RepID=A0ABV9JHV3_9LACT|nr:acyltransferase family protein [Lactococcus nasutitermitis]